MRKTLRNIAFAAVAAITLSPLSSCDRLDDDRIPVTPVNITFQTQADWDIYGVPGALSWKRFIRELRQPANFPYTEMTYTGFGGILLVCDVLGTPQAYDLACPVERSRDVRVNIDPKDEYLAVCPKCGSKYNVVSLTGHPVAGRAAEQGFALRRYYVGTGRGNAYMVVSN